MSEQTLVHVACTIEERGAKGYQRFIDEALVELKKAYQAAIVRGDKRILRIKLIAEEPTK